MNKSNYERLRQLFNYVNITDEYKNMLEYFVDMLGVEFTTLHPVMYADGTVNFSCRNIGLDIDVILHNAETFSFTVKMGDEELHRANQPVNMTTINLMRDFVTGR